MAGFRNLVVHAYAKIDPAIVEKIATHDVFDLQIFVAAVRQHFALAAGSSAPPTSI